MAKKSSKAVSAPGRRNENLKYYLLLAVIVIAVFANSLSNDFVFDDEQVVLSDPSITDLSNIPKYFTGAEGFHKVIGRYYRPVVSVSYAIDYALWGAKPFGFHLTNVIIHIINTLLVFNLLLLLFSNVQSKIKDYVILLGATVFAIHPIHTEAVSWVSGRTDSLFFTFFAASFIYYLKYRIKPSSRNLVFASLFYALSLLAKEMAITLPAVIIMYEIIINKRRSLEFFIKDKSIYISFVLLSVLFLLLRWAVLKDVPERTSYNYFYGKDAATIFFTMLQTLPVYFRLILLPYGMLYHYSGYLPYINSIANIQAMFAIGFILVMLACAFSLFKKMPWIAFSVLFIFVTLSPVLNIIPTMNFMAERFLYLPSLALSFALISLIFKYYSPKRSAAFYLMVSVLVVFYLYLTISRNADWKTNDSLFLSAEGKPGTITYVNIGNIYANKKEYDKAEVYFRKAIDLRGETILANCNLGKIFMVKQNYDSAYYYMYKAYTLDTLSPEPMYSLALLLANYEKYDEAINWLEKVHSVVPAYMNSKLMLEQLRQEKQTSSKKPPGYTTPPVNSIDSLERDSYNSFNQKEYDKSIESLKKLLKLNPQNAASYNNNLGMCYVQMNKFDEATKYFQMAIDSKNDFSIAYNNLGYAYEKMGDKTKAKENYLKAIEKDANNEDAKKHLSTLDK
jgi:tetratricopeptide (TPR) repeat protein